MDFNAQPESRQHTRAVAQATRVLYRRTNFIVLAPSQQNVPRLAREGVEMDLDGHPGEPAAAIADAHTRPERDRSAVVLGASALSVPVWLETMLVFVALGASFAAHAINLFYYPHYEQDEGTYLMYAWAITHGSITNYPYGYGHPPLAWIQLAAWVKLTGGFATFRTAINSGRVLVLLLALCSACLVYQIARHLGASLSASLLALAIFSFSPISLTFQRERFLDHFPTLLFFLAPYLVV